jgi:hypothetical protein
MNWNCWNGPSPLGHPGSEGPDLGHRQRRGSPWRARGSEAGWRWGTGDGRSEKRWRAPARGSWSGGRCGGGGARRWLVSGRFSRSRKAVGAGSNGLCGGVVAWLADRGVLRVDRWRMRHQPGTRGTVARRRHSVRLEEESGRKGAEASGEAEARRAERKRRGTRHRRGVYTRTRMPQLHGLRVERTWRAVNRANFLSSNF